jgi:hypothetical protein
MSTGADDHAVAYLYRPNHSGEVDTEGSDMERFIRTGTMAAAAGGLFLAVGALLSLLPSASEPFSEQVVTGSFALFSTLRFIGALLMLWGVMAIYARQADATGRFGIVAVIASVVNLILQASWMWADLFVAPTLAVHAPEILDGGDMGRLGIAFMAAWVANTSFVLLGIASLRSRVFPRSVGVALIVAGAITLIPLPVDGPAYEVVIGVCFVAAGLVARTIPATLPAITPALAERPRAQPQPSC